MPTRRAFLSAAAVPTGIIFGDLPTSEREPRIQTVRGAVAPTDLGRTLIHEHLLVDFIGADRASKSRYDADEVFRVALPYLTRARELGCRTLVECTPAYLGRDPILLQRLSKASGVRILTNTGYYGASGGKFLPPHAYSESAEQLAERWTKEAKKGIAGTGIRPGFLKIGVDGAPLPEVNRSLVRAAAMTHRATGLTIHQHTGSGAAALEALDLLRQERVGATAFVWVHAQSEEDRTLHLEAARRGAWVEFDGVGPGQIEKHAELVLAMREAGFLKQVLISHDAGWYHVGEPGGGQFRGFESLFTNLLPALQKAGVTNREIHTLLVDNPRGALTPRRRNSRRD